MAAEGTAPARTGYQGFGSWHCEDVEVLIRQSDADYTPPAPLFPDPADLAAASCPASSFGIKAQQHFLIDFQHWTFINHGAFGAVCAPAYKAAEQWRMKCELQPLKFIDRQLFPCMVKVIRELAAFVNCRPQDLVLVANATTGLNAVINSCQLTPGDAVYSLDIGYGSVKKMLQQACQSSGAEMVVGQVALPLSGPCDILSLVSETLPSHTRLAVFDAVTSNTALVLPIKELIQLCRNRGVPVLIDGAHALGMLPLDLQQLQPDFFVSNCHKWLCGARGSAMLYVAPEWQQQVQPPVLSHGAEAGLLSRFIWDGCRDYSPLLAISTAVRWWKGLGAASAEDTAGGGANAAWSEAEMQAADCTAGSSKEVPACCCPGQVAHPGDGGAAARCYMYHLLRQAADLLVQQWGTGCLGSPDMTAAMVLVQLPSGGVLPKPDMATSTDSKFVQDMLHIQHSIEVPVKCIKNTLYVRISAHIYNTLQDYKQLAAAVHQILEQVKT